ncbi:MAG TPA: hypothetical protein VF633_11675 [Brevundimonas sp.]|jgi:hypothetical protein
MKRRIFAIGAPNRPVLMIVAALALLSAGSCSPAKEGKAPQAPSQTQTGAGVDSGWVTPPLIESVERTASGLRVRGHAAPQGRVVLRAAGGTAYAIGADDGGRFDLEIRTPATDTLFMVEAQNGQEASPAPYQMLVSHDAGGPTALLSSGAPTRRMGRAGSLDVVDSDGHALLASGRATPGTSVSIAAAGRAPVQVRTGPDGRWKVILTSEGAGPAEIVVAGRRYAYPGPSLGDSGALVIASNPQGWSVSWPIPPRSRQASWFPVE